MKIQVYIELNKNKAIKEYQSKYSIKMSYWNIKETMHMIYPGKWLLEIYQTIKIFLKIRNQLFRNRIYNIKHCLIRINCIAMKNRLNNKNKHKNITLIYITKKNSIRIIKMMKLNQI